MKILFLANSDLGLYKFRKELIEELISQGHDVFISLPDGDFIKSLEKLGCAFIDTPIDRRGINPKADIILLVKYRKIIKKICPDYIITYTIKPNVYGGIAARLEKKQYAENITGLGTAFEKTGILKAIAIILYRIALKKANVVFFENDSNRDEMLSYNCCSKKKTFVLSGAGVNIDAFGYQPYPTNDNVRFLFIGRVMKEKGIDELFEAMKRLVADGYKCFLDVVGPFEEDYEKILEIYEDAGWLKYHGYQEDVRPFIASCDCFVLPSYHEGMANTILECASSGRPIITSNIPGCKEAVNDGKSGFLCKPKDVESLVLCMKKLISLQRKDREEMGKFGRRIIVETFDKRKVVDETIKALFG